MVNGLSGKIKFDGNCSFNGKWQMVSSNFSFLKVNGKWFGLKMLNLMVNGKWFYLKI